MKLNIDIRNINPYLRGIPMATLKLNQHINYLSTEWQIIEFIDSDKVKIRNLSVKLGKEDLIIASKYAKPMRFS